MDKPIPPSVSGSDVVFLLGAGRSGTTLLYKLLSLHPDIAYISNYENRLRFLPVGWLHRFIKRRMDLKLGAWFNRGNAYFIRRPLFKKIIPTPVEGEPVFARCGLPLTPGENYFANDAVAHALRSRFSTIKKHFGAKVFLSKRTANNRRVNVLRRIFPDAKYIHLIRDGREVAHSLERVEWWDDHVLFWDGRTPRDLERAGDEKVIVCARNWVMEVAELENSLASIEENQIFTLHYESLLRDPISQLGAILDFLGLAMPVEYVHAIESLRLRYRQANLETLWTESQLAGVIREQRSTLQRVGYLDDMNRGS